MLPNGKAPAKRQTKVILRDLGVEIGLGILLGITGTLIGGRR